MPPVPKRLEAFGNTKSPRTFESEEKMGGEGGGRGWSLWIVGL